MPLTFTNEGGKVILGSKRVEKENEAYQRIYVSDNGIGMDADTIKNLFRIEKAKSTRGTANEKGNGLGLLLCKEFAEKQGTQLEVSSTKGKGTEFSFMLHETK